MLTVTSKEIIIKLTAAKRKASSKSRLSCSSRCALKKQQFLLSAILLRTRLNKH